MSRPEACSEGRGVDRSLGRRGFATGADRYERARPGYPEAIVDALADAASVHRGAPVLDVASGTGKLTRELAARGLRCVGIEPSAAMRAVCAAVLPGVPLVAGQAEDLPIVSHAAGLVTVAQAFHWFDPARALAEFARVLVDGGTLALVWNQRDTTVPWVAQLSAIMERTGRSPAHEPDETRALLERDARFTELRHVQVPFVQAVTPDGLCELVASRSWVNVLDATARDRLLAEVRALVDGLDQPLALPYRTDALLAVSIGER